MAEENTPADASSRSASENIHEVTQASKDLFAAGERLSSNLSELEEHVKHAFDWKLKDHVLLITGIGIAGFALCWRLAKR
jgi:hypothetical protein